MATILEGLNAISQAVGGAGEAESNLEALNQISEALGGSADATENAEAIANIAENASGGGGSSDFTTAEVTLNITTASGAAIDSFVDVSGVGTSAVYSAEYYYPPSGYLIDGSDEKYLVNITRNLAGPYVNKLDVILGPTESLPPDSEPDSATLELLFHVGDENYRIEGNVALTGDIRWDATNGVFLVTGDCSITYVIPDDK